MLPEIRTVPLELTISGRSLIHDPAKSRGEETCAAMTKSLEA